MSRILLFAFSFSVAIAMVAAPAFADAVSESGALSFDNIIAGADYNQFGSTIYTPDNGIVTVTGTISNWHGSVNGSWEGLWNSVGLSPTHFFTMSGTTVTGYAHLGDTAYGDIAHQVGFASSNLVFYEFEPQNKMKSQLDDYTSGSYTGFPDLPVGTTFDFEMTYDFAAETLSGSFGGGASATRDLSTLLLDGDSFIFQAFTGNSDPTDNTMGYDISYEISVSQTNIPGDANNDAKVDGSDVTILAGNWQKGVSDGLTAIWEEGDFNADGKVDGSDVTILAGNWQYGVTTAATAVPEPSMMIMLLAMAGFLLRRRR